MTSRKHPCAAFWATVVVVVALVGYPLSFGPACWWFSSYKVENGAAHYVAPYVYWPIGWLAAYGPRPLSRAINWYGTVWIYQVYVYFPPSRTGVPGIVFTQKNK